MIIEPFCPVLPNAALIASAETFFQAVRDSYLDYRHRGMFIEHPRPCLLVYRLTENEQVYYGILAALPADQYSNGLIKKHEGTLAASEQQQLQLLVLREAVVKPVLLTYPAQESVDRLLAQIAGAQVALLRLADGTRTEHELFEVKPESEDGKKLLEAFAQNIEALYIADGHHRCSVLELYNRQLLQQGQKPVPLLAAVFSSAQVNINAYHRIVQLSADLSPLKLLAKLSCLFEIEALSEPFLPENRGEMVAIIADESFRLRWRKPILDQNPDALDAGLFNDLIAEPIFGISDIRNDQRISYLPGSFGLRGMLDRVQRKHDRVGFLLYAVAPEQMFAVVDRGEIMPPKSTWFEPRMRDGLVTLEI